jgi:hypothetical protein
VKFDESSVEISPRFAESFRSIYAAASAVTVNVVKLDCKHSFVSLQMIACRKELARTLKKESVI